MCGMVQPRSLLAQSARAWPKVWLRHCSPCCARIQSGVIFYPRTMVYVHIVCFLFNKEFCLMKITKLGEFHLCAILPVLFIPRDPIQKPLECISNSENWIERIASLSLITLDSIL